MVLKRIFFSNSEEASACLFRSRGRQNLLSGFNRLTVRLSCKGLSSLTQWSLCIFIQVSWEIKYLLRERDLWVSRAVLNRWSCKWHSSLTQETSAHWVVSPRRQSLLSQYHMLRRWSWKGSSLVTQKMYPHCTFIQVFQETKHLPRNWALWLSTVVLQR